MDLTTTTPNSDREAALRRMKRLLMHADLQGGAARALSSAVIALEAELR